MESTAIMETSDQLLRFDQTGQNLYQTNETNKGLKLK